MNSHHSEPTSGIETNSPNRSRSQTTMTPAPVELVGQRTGQRAEHQRRAAAWSRRRRRGRSSAPGSRWSAGWPARTARAGSASRRSRRREVTSHSRRNAGMASTLRTRCEVGADSCGGTAVRRRRAHGPVGCRSGPAATAGRLSAGAADHRGAGADGSGSIAPHLLSGPRAQAATDSGARRRAVYQSSSATPTRSARRPGATRYRIEKIMLDEDQPEDQHEEQREQPGAETARGTRRESPNRRQVVADRAGGSPGRPGRVDAAGAAAGPPRRHQALAPGRGRSRARDRVAETASTGLGRTVGRSGARRPRAGRGSRCRAELGRPQRSMARPQIDRIVAASAAIGRPLSGGRIRMRRSGPPPWWPALGGEAGGAPGARTAPTSAGRSAPAQPSPSPSPSPPPSPPSPSPAAGLSPSSSSPGAAGGGGTVAAADAQHDGLAGQRGAARVLADHGAARRRRCRPRARRPSSRRAAAASRASFSAWPTTSGTRDSAPPSRKRGVRRRAAGAPAGRRAAASSCRTRSRPGSCRRRCCRSRQGNGAPAPSQSGLGALELSKVITAPDICGTTPRNAADLCCWVVPVLPAIGRFQPTWPAAPAAVPAGVVLAQPGRAACWPGPGSTACSHGASVTGTGLPAASVIDSIGLGGHHMPRAGQRGADVGQLQHAGRAHAEGERGLLLRLGDLGDRAVGAAARAGSTNGVVASDCMPSRTAMSTTSGTPVNSSSLMNAVFGDSASASVSDIRSG